jgi:Cellulase (glycosyl hydrolase family 5)
MFIKKSITIRLFLLLCIGLVSTAQPGQKASAEDSAVFLPLVLQGYKPLSDSPFWIEIAAITQITPTGVAAPNAMSESKWRSYLAEVFPTLVDALAESGAGGTRIFINWSWIESQLPVPGQPPNYSWTWYDDRIREIGKTELKIIATVATPPSWASSTICPPINTDHLDEYAQFLTDLVNRYKAAPYRIKYWELDNEPDNTTTNGAVAGYGCWGDHGAEYAAMAATAYAAIKAADPEAYVLMGGIAHDWFTEYLGPFNRYFSDDVMANSGALNFDALNIHYFPDFHLEWERWTIGNKPTCGIVDDGLGATYDAVGIDLAAKASHFRNRMSTCFGVSKPLWVTELGAHGVVTDTASLNEQARYVIQGNVRGSAAGAKKIVWYALLTPSNNDDSALLYDDLSPKPAFTAFKTLTSELMGYQYLTTLNITNGEGYVFSSSTQANKTVAWGSGMLTFTPASQLRTVDRYGNVGTVYDGSTSDQDHSVNRSIRLQMTIEPIFFQIIN